MKAVMMSINSKWVEKILNGEKTIEVRKTAPKWQVECSKLAQGLGELGKMYLEPIKVYIYCTKGGELLVSETFCNYITTKRNSDIPKEDILNGKVVAEFTCDRIECAEQYDDFLTQYVQYPIGAIEWEQTCLTYKELTRYGNGKPLYLWHISDLKIYDKPRELGEYSRKMHCYAQGDYDNLACWECCEFYDRGECDGSGEEPLTRPPQSWGYVEEL